MKNLNEYVAKANANMLKLGYEMNPGNTFRVNTRALTRWGQCRHNPDGTHIIEISYRLMEDSVSEEALMNTLMHELIHTIKGCNNHGVNFKRVAAQINRAYGLNIKTCTSAAEKGVAEVQRKVVIKHRFVCEDCGQTVERQRESDFTRRYQRYTCGCCGGAFKKLF
jgi:predicted SprT family Zn-dependent metalloprotease